MARHLGRLTLRMTQLQLDQGSGNIEAVYDFNDGFIICMKMTMEFFGYGARVDVRIPPSSEVTDMLELMGQAP